MRRRSTGNKTEQKRSSEILRYVSLDKARKVALESGVPPEAPGSAQSWRSHLQPLHRPSAGPAALGFASTPWQLGRRDGNATDFPSLIRLKGT